MIWFIFSRLQCTFCEEKLKTWSNLHAHYAREHKSEPYVFCLCGFVVRSKSVLYKHVSDHKLESRKLKMNSETDDEKQDVKYSSLNVKDFIRWPKYIIFLIIELSNFFYEFF